jgi:hypothetical protein
MRRGDARGQTPCVSAPSALALVWVAAQSGHVGYYASRPLWATRHCAGRPHQYCASGLHAEAGPLALNYLFKFFRFNSNFVNLKNLHRIHLNSENYETKFLG